MDKKIVIIALLGIVAISGCTSTGGQDPFTSFIQSLTGGNNVVQRTPDLIITKDMKTIPNPPVTADNDFSVLFTIENQDNISSVDNVNIMVYNWGICKVKSTGSKPDFEPDPTLWSDYPNSSYTRTFDYMAPLEEQQIEMRFTAPSNEEMGSIPQVCPIKWIIDYKFFAVTQDSFTVISKTRLNELQRSGQSWSGTIAPQEQGIGPIKITDEFTTSLPAQAKSTITFKFRISDLGAGTFTKVDKDSMYFKVPIEWTSSLTDAQRANPCSGAGNFTMIEADNGKGYTVYRNYNKEIQLTDKQSSQIICNFKAPDLDSINIPEKSYLIFFNITNYTYKLTGETSVDVAPGAGVLG